MAEYFPHPRDFICIRENETAYSPPIWYFEGGGFKVPFDKIFVPVAVGSKVWIESATAGYAQAQVWGLWAALSYNGPVPGFPEYDNGTIDYNTYNHVAEMEGWCGVFGPMTNEFQAVGKFRSGMCTIARLPVGIFYRGGTDVLVMGGPKNDAPHFDGAGGTPAADTDLRLYGFLCDA